VGLNSSSGGPFLLYLTVFKSRVGGVLLVLELTSFAYTPSITLKRKLKGLLSERLSVGLSEQNESVLRYLSDKRLIGTSVPRSSGRYTDVTLAFEGNWKAKDKTGKSIDQIEVYRTDLWLSAESLPSTVGVPTPENTDEVIELAEQLGLLSHAKCSWTAASQLVVGLRARSRLPENPMMLGWEAAAILRQLVRVDGLLLAELAGHLAPLVGARVRRDAISLVLPDIAERALVVARQLRRPPPEITEGRRFVELLRKTQAKRAQASGGPGVLEHRTAPRLEWLTDFGMLSKRELQKNGFEYEVTTDLVLFSSLCVKHKEADIAKQADEIALEYWRKATFYADQRKDRITNVGPQAYVAGYKLMQRSVGPVSIGDVGFAASILSANTMSHREVVADIISWASQTPGVTLSGGRYNRGPELIHIADLILKDSQA
jgi:hypothetical protein